MTRKELAIYARFSVTCFAKGIGKDAAPNAIIAVKIAKYLDTTVEYLVTGKNPETINMEQDLDMFYSYYNTLQALDKMIPAQRKPIETMICDMTNAYYANKDNHIPMNKIEPLDEKL